MITLLHIDASPRGERSHSRRLTKEFVETWKKANPTDAIVLLFIAILDVILFPTSTKLGLLLHLLQKASDR